MNSYKEFTVWVRFQLNVIIYMIVVIMALTVPVAIALATVKLLLSLETSSPYFTSSPSRRLNCSAVCAKSEDKGEL